MLIYLGRNLLLRTQSYEQTLYVYDFEDDSIHDITLEDIIEELHPHASCMASKGTCPEEDCGGLWGYEDMKENREVEPEGYEP